MHAKSDVQLHNPSKDKGAAFCTTTPQGSTQDVVGELARFHADALAVNILSKAILGELVAL